MKKPSMEELTTTSFAILGLLAVRSWSTYELARQMERSTRNFWPRAASQVYEEPKRLAALRLASAKKEPTGKRPRTVYSITAKGRRALRRWLSQEAAPPRLEDEGLLKVFLSDQGTREQLVETLARIRERCEEEHQVGVRFATEYLETGGPFPERHHIIRLITRLLSDMDRTRLQWARWAEEEVATWPGVSGDERPPLRTDVWERILREGGDHVGGN